jgi:hypothetical protein
MQFRSLVTAMVAATGAIGLLAAGGSVMGSAMASTHVSHATSTGREVASYSGSVSYGVATKKNQTIPVTLRGVVNTTGKAQLGGYTKDHSFITKAGRLTLRSPKLVVKPKILNARTCFLRETVNDISPDVLGNRSTGAFKGAKGVGHAVVVFQFHFPRNAAGKCNYNGTPKHKGTIKFTCVFPAMKVAKPAH